MNAVLRSSGTNGGNAPSEAEDGVSRMTGGLPDSDLNELSTPVEIKNRPVDWRGMEDRLLELLEILGKAGW